MLRNIEGNVLFVDGANTYYKKQNYDWGGCSITLEKATDLTPNELETMKVVTPSDYPFYHEITQHYFNGENYIEDRLKYIYEDEDIPDYVIDMAVEIVNDNYYALIPDSARKYIGFQKYFAETNAIDDVIAGLHIETNFDVDVELSYDSREKPEDINEWDIYDKMEWLGYNPGDFMFANNYHTLISISWNYIGSGSSRMGMPTLTIGDNYISMSRSEGE